MQVPQRSRLTARAVVEDPVPEDRGQDDEDDLPPVLSEDPAVFSGAPHEQRVVSDGGSL
jgi:hypothetical protein